MTRAAFRQVDLTRAIKGAKAGGFDPARAEILPDGRIVLTLAAEAPTDDAYGAWKAKREGDAKRRSQG